VGLFSLFPWIDDRVATTDWQDEHPPAPSHLRVLYLGRILQDDETLTRMCFVYKGWELKFIYRSSSRNRAQVPILYPAGTRNAHDCASLHTLVCTPRRHVPEEEEASDVSIGLQCKCKCKCKCNPGWDGHVARRAAWVRLLLRYLLAPLFRSRFRVAACLQVFHRSKRTRMLSEPNVLVAYLAAFWRLI
jgi:hypothetical protein